MAIGRTVSCLAVELDQLRSGRRTMMDTCKGGFLLIILMDSLFSLFHDAGTELDCNTATRQKGIILLSFAVEKF